MTAFSTQHGTDEVCQTCLQNNEFVLEMPQDMADKLQLRGIVNGTSTAILPVGELYQHPNTAQGTTNKLELAFNGGRCTLVEDLSEFDFTVAEELSVVIVSETPPPQSSSMGQRRRDARRGQRTPDPNAAAVTPSPGSRARRDARRAQSSGRSEFIEGDIQDVISIELPSGYLPTGTYDIEKITGPVLDKVAQAIANVWGVSLHDVLEASGITGTNLPPAMADAYAAAYATLDLAQDRADRLARKSPHLTPQQIAQFKRTFIWEFMSEQIASVRLQTNGVLRLGFKGTPSARSAMRGGVYKTSIIETGAMARKGQVAGVTKSAFKGAALVGFVFVSVINVAEWLSQPASERDLSDLLVDLAIDTGKMVIAAIAGAVTIAAFATAGAPLFLVVAFGIGMGWYVGTQLDKWDKASGLTVGAKHILNRTVEKPKYGPPVRY